MASFIDRYRDSVSDVTTSTGAGDIVLKETPPVGYRTFGAAYGAGTAVPTCITIRDGATGDFETCLATYNDATKTLTRGTVQSGSNGGSHVNFAAGEKAVYVAMPSAALGAVRWRLLDLFSFITLRETNIALSIPDTSPPASPQVTETVLAGDLIADENVTQYAGWLGVAVTNAGGGGASGYNFAFTKNGTELISASVSVSAGVSVLAACRYGQQLAAGDVLGVKIHRTSGSGSLTANWRHYFALPREVVCGAKDLMGRVKTFEAYTTNAEPNLSFPSPLNEMRVNSSGLSIDSTKLEKYTPISGAITLGVDRAGISAAARNPLPSTKGGIQVASLPRYIEILTINDLA